ncbi:GntR family transcriptional regulator [Hoeflea poritis]|uniref:GntR family transcriptional regulator n=1 Tax=Hoeflea poritis TaxID=2993659 RepID=A0ABT4VV05_9HYPH|nr:GntR family transcriptional regulator [Hoeflea poritis]MDA4848552.1 GntR family transcriptional regulator [Hoeflea poritis]
MMTGARLSWKEVRDRIHQRILSGDYAPGDRLPRDADIAEELHCARSTVQRAMQDLSDGGIVERRRKGGTRVRSDPVTRATLDIPVTRTEVEQKGARYGYQLISSKTAMTPRSVTGNFELAQRKEMLRVKALHLSDGRPYILEDRWVDTTTVPEILDIDLTTVSANEWLVQNKPYSRCDLRFYAESASPESAELLNAKIGDALFVIERTTWIDEAPITLVRAQTAPGYQLLTRI